MAQAHNTRFDEAKRKAILAEADTGTPVTQVCKAHDISATTFYKWKDKYGVTQKVATPKPKTSGWQRRKPTDLEAENRRLKDILLDVILTGKVPGMSVTH